MSYSKTPSVSYAQKLKDPRWQKKRLEALESKGWSCEMCSGKDETLHVHHRQYFKGREPWDYEPGQLAVLCETCHEETHGKEDPLLMSCSYVKQDGSPVDRDVVSGLVAGFAGLDGIECDPLARASGRLAYLLMNSGWAVGGLTVGELLHMADSIDKDPQAFFIGLRSILGLKDRKPPPQMDDDSLFNPAGVAINHNLRRSRNVT